jgi:hypothetical protein
METYANKQSLDDDMKIYGGELSCQEIDKIYIAFRQFSRLNEKYAELDQATDVVADLTIRNDDDAVRAEAALEILQEKLQTAVRNAATVWDSAFACLKRVKGNREKEKLREELRTKTIADAEKAEVELKRKEEARTLPNLQFFRSLQVKALGANEDDVHNWAAAFVRTLVSSAIRPWRCR